MKIKIFLTIIFLILGFLAYVAVQPTEMLITRELFIKANPEILFPWINNSKRSNEWMPWKIIDPVLEMNYAGPDEGVGSISKWDSNGQMGTGEAIIVESIPNKLVKTQLTYTKPMQMSQIAEVSLNPPKGGTIIRWSVTGKNKYIGKLFGVLMNMDKIVGGQFETGLSKLKSLVEKNN